MASSIWMICHSSRLLVPRRGTHSDQVVLVPPKDRTARTRLLDLSDRQGRGKLWAGRYHAAIVDDDEATQVARLEYLLSNGVKEGLVWNSKDWPGVHSARALIECKPLEGIWISRTRQWAARRRKGEDSSDAAHCEAVEIHLEPLPCWAHLPEQDWRGLVLEMVERIEKSGRRQHMEDGTRPLGPRQVRKVHPHHAPERVAWSAQPVVVSRSLKRRQELWFAVASVKAAFRDAAEKLSNGARNVRFPEGTFPPGLPYVPTVADLLAGS